MQPVGVVQKDTAVGGNRVVAVKKVVESGDARAVGVDRLRRLDQLLRVTEEDHGPGSRRDGDGIGQRELPGLVDDQHVSAMS